MHIAMLGLVFFLALGGCSEVPDVADYWKLAEQRLGQYGRDEVLQSDERGKIEDFSNGEAIAIVSEDLLNAEGNWNIVEQGRDVDPAKAHLIARERVNVKSFKKQKDLTAHFEPNAKSGQDGTLRVLQVQVDEEGFSELDDVSTALVAEDIPDLEVSKVDVSSANHVDLETDKGNEAQPKHSGRIASLFGNILGLSKKDKHPKSPKVALVKGDEEQDSGKDEAALLVANAIVMPPPLPDIRLPSNQKQFASIVQKSQEELTKEEVEDEAVVPVPQRKSATAALNALAVLRSVKVKSANAESKLVTKSKSSAQSAKVVQSSASKKDAVRISSAYKIRSGRHPGLTRLVIEVSALTKYKVAIDNLRNVLRIKLENTHWGMTAQSKLKGSDLFGTYIAREQSDGSVLFEVRLTEKTEILKTLILPPNDRARYRVIIDLKD